MYQKRKFTLYIDNNFDFSVATLLAYDNNHERLHGHNFSIKILVEVYEDYDFFTLDFRMIKKIVKRICKDLDEYFLLPKYSDQIKYKILDKNVEINYNDKFYSIPISDIKIINLPNITCESLSFYLSNKILNEIEHNDNISKITVQVFEKKGQMASYKVILKGDE